MSRIAGLLGLLLFPLFAYAQATGSLPAVTSTPACR